MGSALAFGVEPDRSPYRLRLARYKEAASAIARFLGEPKRTAPMQLLDVGVGSGRLLRYLEAEGADGALRLHGIDLDPLRLAQLYKPDRWLLARADVEAGLPYADGCFDIVVCEQVLEHLSRPQAVMRDIRRVLRPGGLLVAGVPTFPPGIDHVRRSVVPRLDRLQGKRRGHVQVFTNRSIVKLIAGTGFDVLATRGFRIVSGGILAPLEHFQWWWRLNRAVGRVVPSLCTEVQVLACKPETTG
jgi:SAM-dependent methyltransferase